MSVRRLVVSLSVEFFFSIEEIHKGGKTFYVSLIPTIIIEEEAYIIPNVGWSVGLSVEFFSTVKKFTKWLKLFIKAMACAS